MLKRILDTKGIDMENDKVRADLTADLIRIDRMDHVDLPKGCDTYRIQVKSAPAIGVSKTNRFRYEIQYGNIVQDEFLPRSQVSLYMTENLPSIKFR